RSRTGPLPWRAHGRGPRRAVRVLSGTRARGRAGRRLRQRRGAGMSDRDLVGYGERPPDPRWPGGARLALNFVLNYEEGGERTPLEGDAESESFLHEVVGAAPTI